MPSTLNVISGCESFSFLGHLINQNNIMVDLSKIDVVMKREVPNPPSHFCNILMLVDYYNRFILDISNIVVPLMQQGQVIDYVSRQLKP